MRDWRDRGELTPELQLILSTIARALAGRAVTPELLADVAHEYRDAIPRHQIVVEHQPRPPKGSKPRPRASYTVRVRGPRIDGQWRFWPGLFSTLLASEILTDDTGMTIEGLKTVSDDLAKRLRAISGRRAIIKARTELWRDLGLYGDDAFELLEAIHTDCGVDFSDLDFTRFFPNETEGTYYWWGRRIGLWRKRFASLTVGHLDAVIARRQWFDP